ncbi:hypothetical protein HQ520_10050 [bacterium]|nr:hypothetical protein [bacterium]
MRWICAWIALLALWVTSAAAAPSREDLELCLNPYRDVKWDQTEHYKANLHTHTTESDGKLEPAKVIDLYSALGYRALAITDHNRSTWPWETYDRSPDDYDYTVVETACERATDFAVSAHAGFEVMNSTARHVGDEAMYLGLATGDPGLLTFIERYVDIKFEILKRTIKAAEGGIDFIKIGEDLGTQRGPRISLEMFHERIRPVHQRFVDLAKEHGLPVMIHSCGSSSWAFDDFIEMGIAVVDTLQPEAKDMAPAYLKKRYGDRLAFHGCISTAGPVATGSVQDTIDYCRRTLEIMMSGGGYCFAPTHQLQDNTPTENVVAMYETAREYGTY